MRLGQAAALKVGQGSAQAGIVLDAQAADAFARVTARFDRHWYGFVDANARWQHHKRAAYSIAGGVGATW